jgi:hypothetical protein
LNKTWLMSIEKIPFKFQENFLWLGGFLIKISIRSY